MMESKFDIISKPSHYEEGRKYKPKDVIRAWGLNFNLGSALKYISRAGRKDDTLQDLRKARQFIEFELEYALKHKDAFFSSVCKVEGVAPFSAEQVIMDWWTPGLYLSKAIRNLAMLKIYVGKDYSEHAIEDLNVIYTCIDNEICRLEKLKEEKE